MLTYIVSYLFGMQDNCTVRWFYQRHSSKVAATQTTGGKKQNTTPLLDNSEQNYVTGIRQLNFNIYFLTLAELIFWSQVRSVRSFNETTYLTNFIIVLSIGRSKRRWEDNIRMDLKEIFIKTRNWIDSAQDRTYKSSCECGIEPPGSINHWVSFLLSNLIMFSLRSCFTLSVLKINNYSYIQLHIFTSLVFWIKTALIFFKQHKNIFYTSKTVPRWFHLL